MRRWSYLGACALLLVGCASGSQDGPGHQAATSGDAAPPQWCGELPRSEYAALEQVDVDSDWFEVWDVGEDVFALYEPKQWQEKVSYLIQGQERALLFDTGTGIGSISNVVEQLTELPVVVLNSDTHPDHTGGNSEFSTILAMDTEFTRERARGYSNERVRGELSPEALCASPPPGVTQEEFEIRLWSATDTVGDGHVIDLGGRMLEVIGIPGHAPDAIALLDPEVGYLWSGDSFYEGTIWLFFPETDLDSYAASVERLASLAPTLNRVLPAHNAPVSDPIRLVELRDAFSAIQEGTLEGTPYDSETVRYPAGMFSLRLAVK